MTDKTDTYKTLARTNIASDEYYYKYIFKKTEKIVCAVFYILTKRTNEFVSETVVKDVETVAKRTHDAVLATLSLESHTLAPQARALTHRLMDLDSKLHVLVATGMLAHEHFLVFHNEIDSVLRSIKPYTETANEERALLGGSGTVPERTSTTAATGASGARVERVRPSAPAASAGVSRRELITRVLADNPRASIKDISGVITDCSEKTVQRELNAMIKDGTVFREGKRRWSTYSLV